MGGREIGLSLMFLIFLYGLGSSSSSEALPSGRRSGVKATRLLKTESMLGVQSGDKGVQGETAKIYGRKFGGSTHGSVSGSGSTGSAENGNHGTSGSSNPQGGQNFIPVYAAASANKHNSHHGAGNCNQNRIGFPALLAMTFISAFI